MAPTLMMLINLAVSLALKTAQSQRPPLSA